MDVGLALFARESASSDLSPYEYCMGSDSICSAFNNLDRDCNDQNGAEYYECICESGWVSTNRACRYCMYVTGQVSVIEYVDYFDVCSEEGFSVAPMPSSIVSEQRERNKTVSVPEPEPKTTSPSTLTSSSTFPFELKTGSHEPHTVTYYGTPSASLPDIAPTETNIGTRHRLGLGNFLIISMALALCIAVSV
ncbi:hypothetical protein BGZ61DRAFT_470060 [Ilyonectria robusta]|uniref:uncharacterized protein n=1 Tax=Ilyonectria robusta TaxID=1079257 RepID=UPI001E8E84BC|nr:uncharacterized protein BGZ61DRAFT_470060 [Ilyonectria robusta]KAH8646028.1 hypothetical protein BGZ61DRAFT_470060 [Ilyonectria robusta]